MGPTMKARLALLYICLPLFLLAYPASIFAQGGSAELISVIAPPQLDNVPLNDGDRYVVYDNQYIYIANYWGGIQIYNVANESKPARMSVIQTNDNIHQISLNDNKLYVANQGEGVTIYDVSDKAAPRRIGQIKTPGNAYWVDVAYPLIYVALGNDGFCVMNISDLSDTRTLSLEIPGTWIWSIMHRDQTLFAGAKQGGLLIYDATNPEKLTKISQYKTNYQTLQLQLEDNLAYIADGPGGLLILDVSNPAVPKKVSRYESQGFSQNVYKSGNYAYLSNRELGLLIVNVKDPAKPTLAAQYTPDSETYASVKHDVFVFLATNTALQILRHNNRPTLQPIANPVLNENAPFVLQLQAADPDGDSLSFEAQNLPDGSTFDKQTGLFSWTPTFEQSGIYPNVIFTAIEKTQSHLSVSDTVDITVNQVNRNPDLPPVANQTIKEDSLLIITLAPATDPDSEDIGKLTYHAENLPEGASFDSLQRVFSWKPTYDQSGIYPVDFVVEDGAGGTDRETSTITVLHVDRPPVLQPVADQTVDEGDTLLVTLQGSDPDKEDQDKISFNILNLPQGATFNPVSRELIWVPTYDQSGIYPDITAIMTAGKLADSSSFTITVNHVNRPPQLARIGDKTVQEDSLLKFKIQFSDPDVEDSGKVAVQASNLPEGATFSSDSLVFSWLPTFDQAGVYPGITFAVQDPQGLKASESITITVKNVDRPPVLEALPPFTVNENELLEYQLIANDPDTGEKEKLVFSGIDLPDGAVLDTKTGFLQWTPSYEQAGVYKVTLTVSDGELSNSKTTTITVNNVNRPPVLAPLPDKLTDENMLLSFGVPASDPDAYDSGKLVYYAGNLPPGAKFDPSTHTFTWIPTFEQSGIYGPVLFGVKDSLGLSDEKSITITVKNVNRPPALESIPPIVVNENQPVRFQLAGSDKDREDKGKLVYHLANAPAGAALNASTGGFNWTPGYDQAGNYALNFTVTDSAGASANTTVDIKVNNVNRAPQLSAVPARQIRENEPFTLVLPAAADSDKEDSGKLKYTLTNQPRGASFDENSHTFKWTPSFDQAGSYNMTYQVKDLEGATAQQPFNLTVTNVNRAPTINPVGNKSVDIGKELSFALKASDPDKEDDTNLAYSADGLPSGAAFDAGTGRFSWTPAAGQEGEYAITFTVTDKQGLKGNTTVNITVNGVPPQTN